MGSLPGIYGACDLGVCVFVSFLAPTLSSTADDCAISDSHNWHTHTPSSATGLDFCDFQFPRAIKDL